MTGNLRYFPRRDETRDGTSPEWGVVEAEVMW